MPWEVSKLLLQVQWMPRVPEVREITEVEDEEDEEVFKWAAASLYGGGADTVG